MYVRCAYFEGEVAAADRERFESIVRTRIVPTMRNFPNIRRVRLLWGREHETPDRHIYLVIEHTYDSLADIETAITSDVRAGMRPILDELLPLFEGKVYHVNYYAESFLDNA